MKFKYQNEIAEFGLEDCPPKAYFNAAFTAYRFVFNDIQHPNNFNPIGLISPKRLNDFKEDMQKCQSLGLSMFAESEKALTKFRHLQKKTAGRFAKTVGDSLATLNLEIVDGVHSEINADNASHFTFHEFENSDLINRVVHIETCEI